MSRPRFTIRTLLTVVLFASLSLGIVAITRENARLRRELADAARAKLSLRLFVSTATFNAQTATLSLLTALQDKRGAMELDNAGGDAMPNGSQAFAGAEDGIRREVNR